MQGQEYFKGISGAARKGGCNDYDEFIDEEQIIKSFIKSERHDEARETAERMIKMGKLSLDEISLYVPSLSFDELRELEAEVMQSV